MWQKVKNSILIFSILCILGLFVQVSNVDAANTFRCIRDVSPTLPCSVDLNNINCDSANGYGPTLSTCLIHDSADCPVGTDFPCQQPQPPPPPNPDECYQNCLDTCLSVPGNTPEGCQGYCELDPNCQPPGGPGDGGSPGGNQNDVLVDLNQLLDNAFGDTFKFKSDNSTLGAIITGILPILYGIAGIVLLLFLIGCGFRYLTSAGDPKKTEGAKNCLTATIIGFVIVITAFWLTQIANYIFNLGSSF